MIDGCSARPADLCYWVDQNEQILARYPVPIYLTKLLSGTTLSMIFTLERIPKIHQISKKYVKLDNEFKASELNSLRSRKYVIAVFRSDWITS